MSGHLKGWRVSAGDEHTVFDANGLTIARSSCGGLTQRTYDEATEVARLIAAAPELLEALETAMQWIKAWDVGFLFDEEWPADEAKINAALAKARGAA